MKLLAVFARMILLREISLHQDVLSMRTYRRNLYSVLVAWVSLFVLAIRKLRAVILKLGHVGVEELSESPGQLLLTALALPEILICLPREKCSLYFPQYTLLWWVPVLFREVSSIPQAFGVGERVRIIVFWRGYILCQGILVPRPGMEPTPPSLEVWSFKHWTAREIQELVFFFFLRIIVFKQYFSSILGNPWKDPKTLSRGAQQQNYFHDIKYTV